MIRPTFEALARIESVFGPLLDVISKSPSLADVAGLLDLLAVNSPGFDEIERAVFEVGLGNAQREVMESISICFPKRGSDAPVESEALASREFPVETYVGQLVAVLRVAPSEAWQMTVPEYWEAMDCFARVNAAPDPSDPGPLVPEDRIPEMKARLRDARRRDKQRAAAAAAEGDHL